MTQAMRDWFANLRNRSFLTQSAVLALSVLLAYGLVAPVAVWLGGVKGLVQAGVAAGLCLLGAALALAVCRRLRGPDYALHRVLAGLLFRMGIPLAAGMALCLQGGALAEPGILVYLVVFYPVTLFVETALLLPSDDRPCGRNEVSENVVL
jgi:hypothetical protein